MAYKDDQDRFFQEQLELREQRLLARLYAGSPLADPEEIGYYVQFMTSQCMIKNDVRYDTAKELVLLTLERAVDLDIFDERFDVKP